MKGFVKISATFLSLLLISAPTFAAKNEKQKADPFAMPPAVVRIEKAKAGTWQQHIESVGTVKANQGIIVQPEIAGRITKIFFKSGKKVKGGEPLIQLDPGVLKAQLDNYQAELVQATSDYKRYSDLIRKKAVSQSDYDKVVATYKADTAKVAQAQAQLNQTLIKAPFSGRLGIRLVSLGDYVAAGTDLVNLQQTDPVFIDFFIAQTHMSKIKLTEEADVLSDAYADETFEGKIVAFNSSLDSNTRMLEVRAIAKNPDDKLTPGSFVKVRLGTGKTYDVTIVPQTAISTSLKGSYVYRVIDGKAVVTPVKVINRTNDLAMISKGLKPGETIVVAGQVKLHDGAPIMPADNMPSGTTGKK